MRQIAEQWLEPIDREIASLLDDADRLTVGAFYQRMQEALDRLPKLFDEIDPWTLANDLEEKMGEAVIAGLRGKDYRWQE